MEVYIIFTDTKTSLSRMIKTYTQHPYSHVSISFDPGLGEVYSFGRKNVGNAFIGGFVKEDMHNHLFQRAHCAVYKCSVTPEGYSAIRALIDEMELQHDQYTYNLSGLFGVVMNRGVERKNSFFCSQFIAELLKRGGVRISDKPASLIMPRDIFYSDELQFLYSGMMTGYPLLKPKSISARPSENSRVVSSIG